MALGDIIISSNFAENEIVTNQDVQDFRIFRMLYEEFWLW
ncbi:hypothetical protein NSP_48430 [Nodularia spumigena CCY9414]|nr:hypothetical protein NSP_48430 [Nodularia spumigena CCY9414]